MFGIFPKNSVFSSVDRAGDVDRPAVVGLAPDQVVGHPQQEEGDPVGDELEQPSPVGAERQDGDADEQPREEAFAVVEDPVAHDQVERGQVAAEQGALDRVGFEPAERPGQRVAGHRGARCDAAHGRGSVPP